MTTSIGTKRTLTATLPLLAIAGVISFATAAKTQHAGSRGEQERLSNAAPPRCTMGTIRGAYAMHAEGTVFLPTTTPPTGVPVVTLNRYEFDGAGNSRGAATTSFNGQIERSPITGTYTLKEDCTGTFTDTLPNGFTVTSDIVVADGAKEIYLIETNSGAVLNGSMKRL